ncbi:MAG: single-stranded-DNA-specific exonuclease RecJ [Deltaproteobacteria bacterium]|nr:single-stranded-DNA-specific exonuclease RecJ [Deltaproteobacteria bacterium]
MEWHIAAPDPERQRALVTVLGITPVTAQILLNRAIDSPEAAAAFLTPRLDHLHDPYRLPDMAPAVERLVRAVLGREAICCFGDYDTDGVTGTALAVRFFAVLGLTPRWYVPHRTRDGYGLTIAALERLLETGPRPSLILTIDNGTGAHAAIAWANERGIDVVVTDHHEVPEILPPAVAIVNPKRRDTEASYPFPGLCGVGVCFKLCTAIRQRLRTMDYFRERPEPNLARWLDLVMIGTIADVVPLQGENRVLCTYGLKTLAATKNAGLTALCRIAGVERARATGRQIAFQIAPRLNAAGRLGDAGLAVELLTTDDTARAEELAATLHALNAERQGIEEGIGRDVRALPETTAEETATVVAASETWPAGVIGIVAGRIAQSCRKPTILISLQDGHGIGSARGIGDFPLLAAIERCAEHLLRFGGHAKAAGITIARDRIPAFRAAFEAAARALLTPADRLPTVHIDAEVTPEEMTTQLVQEIERLAPFGEGNPEPVLCTRNAGIKERRIVGGKHLKFAVHGDCLTVEAIGFAMGDHPERDADRMDLAFTPEHNEWNGLRQVQLKLKHLRACQNPSGYHKSLRRC